jgi:hypothetical protein
MGPIGFTAADITAIVPFPTAGDAYTSATDGNGTIPAGGMTEFQWTAGDSVTSAIFNLGASSVNSLTANWTFQDDLIGATETWFVLINGTAIAQATLPDCSGCDTDVTITGTVGFADIFPVAGGYQIQLVLQNTLATGQGSVAWLDGGITDLNVTTPEPASLMMVGSGMLAFAGLLRRKRS